MQLGARGMLQCDIKDRMAFRAMNLIEKATTTSAFRGYSNSSAVRRCRDESGVQLFQLRTKQVHASFASTWVLYVL